MAYRVFVAQFMHETNTFSKLPTTLDDYRKRWLIEGEAMVARFKGTRNEVGGYIDSIAKYGWQPAWGAAANATPSGTLTKETWETIRDMIVGAARRAGKLDGICLSLHGAMVAATEDDAEGALLEALRGIVGPEVPMVATLDLHANATERMARNANALVSYRTYPHIDGYERAVQAAALCQEALEGKKKPRCLLVQPAMLEGADHGRTTYPGQMRELLAKADTFEKEPGINVVSIQAGFTWSDIPYTGPSIAVSHEPSAEARARAIARELIDDIWRRRDETIANTAYRSIADGIAAARAHSDPGGVGKKGPLVIADGTDNPGGGGYNDTTPVLQALIDAKIDNVGFGTICDPAAVQQAATAGVGAEIEVSLGGHTDESMGKPVRTKAIVKMLSDGIFKNDGPDERRRRDRHGADGRAAHRRDRRGDDLQSHPDHRPAGVPEPGHRSHRQERAGGQERAAFPSRLRTDRARDRGGRFRRHMLARYIAPQIQETPPADLANRRHQRSFRRPARLTRGTRDVLRRFIRVREVFWVCLSSDTSASASPPWRSSRARSICLIAPWRRQPRRRPPRRMRPIPSHSLPRTSRCRQPPPRTTSW
jgi:microcystin degradation protein MlrC